jgi:hypothetical protein
MPRDTVHPNNHGHDKQRRDQQHQPLESILADFPTLKRNGDTETGNHSGGNSAPHPAHQGGAARAVQIDQNDANDKRGLNAFA